MKAAFLALAGAAIVLTLNVGASTEAEAQQRRATQRDPNNYSYQQGPRTRIFVSRRSWLDAGTEVLPGERKFTDYAFPPGYSIAEQIDPHTQFRRQGLPDPWDLPGYPKF